MRPCRWRGTWLKPLYGWRRKPHAPIRISISLMVTYFAGRTCGQSSHVNSLWSRDLSRRSICPTTCPIRSRYDGASSRNMFSLNSHSTRSRYGDTGATFGRWTGISSRRLRRRGNTVSTTSSIQKRCSSECSNTSAGRASSHEMMSAADVGYLPPACTRRQATSARSRH